jgi:hypothetical protein
MRGFFCVFFWGFARLSSPTDGGPAKLPPFTEQSKHDEMPKQVSQNVRFQLYRRGLKQEEWESFLASEARLEPSRVAALLGGRLDDSEIAPEELKHLAVALDLPSDAEELRFADLLQDSQTDIFLGNVLFLLDSLKKGQKQELAAHLGVDPNTISRWTKKGLGRRSTAPAKFLQFFGLHPETDLKTTPLFLESGPVSVDQCRAWVAARIEQIGAHEFQLLYPALKRLLEER